MHAAHTTREVFKKGDGSAWLAATLDQLWPELMVMT